GLWHLANRLPPPIVAKLAATASAEPESRYRVYLNLASYVAARAPKQAKHHKDLVVLNARKGTKDEKYQTAAVLALRGASDDIPLLADLLNDPDADVRVSAANAVLQIQRRKP